MMSVLNRVVLIVFFMLLACVFVPGAMAQQQESDFNKMDSSGDGVVTKDELHRFRDKKFDEIDSNGNGTLEMDELKSHKDRSFKGLDKDKDNTITREEYMIGKNGELVEVPENKKALAKQALNDPSKGAFERIDTDNNGEIDKEEHAAHSSAVFELGDKDSDKRLTDEEDDMQFNDYVNNLDANRDDVFSRDEYSNILTWDRCRF